MNENEWFYSTAITTLTHPEREKLILALNFYGIELSQLVLDTIRYSSSTPPSPIIFVRQNSKLFLFMFPGFEPTSKELHAQDLLDIIELSCL